MMTEQGEVAFRKAQKEGTLGHYFKHLPYYEPSLAPWVFDGLAIYSLGGKVGSVAGWDEQNVWRIINCINGCRSIEKPELVVPMLMRAWRECR